MYKQIGNKVAYYRKLRNLTQDQLADRVSISVSSISKLQRGKECVKKSLYLWSSMINF